MSIPIDRLVAEALSKSGLLWVSSEAGGAPVWHAHVDGVAYVVSGEGEQFSPEHSGRCEVIARSKESRARLLSFQADAERLTPASPDWEVATNALKAGRLNAHSQDMVAEWAESAHVIRLQPDLTTVVLRGQLLEQHDGQARTSPQDEAESNPPVSQPTAGKVSE